MRDRILKKLTSQTALMVYAALLSGAVLGWSIERYVFPPASYRGVALFQSSDDYQFIDPLLACDIGAEDTFPELASSRAAVGAIIDQAKRDGRADSVSVYMRRLKSARWFEINGSNTYTPASLFKVFVLMAYYKEADDSGDPGLLQHTVTFEGNSTTTTDITGKKIPHLVAGQGYTIARLINQMIVYSDNDAATTLINNFDPKTWAAFNALFSDLKIPSPEKQESALLPMTVEQYAMVFRVLFGATYLSRQYSEDALNLLSQTTYTDGIATGVGQGVAVSHKYGDAIDPSVQLHDCGVVYYPDHPYLLCVMTSGKDFASLQGVIQEISKSVYEDADKAFKK